MKCKIDLFYNIATQKKKVGSIAPKKFIARLRKEKEEFDNYMQQDAHEFLNFLINHINEIILAERNANKNGSAAGTAAIKSNSTTSTSTTASNSSTNGTCSQSTGSINGIGIGITDASTPTQTNSANTEPTWVHEIFQGTLTSETRCLNCETVSSKDEHFFDLQVDVDRSL